MNVLSVNPVSPVALSVLRALSPAQTVTVPPTPNGNPTGASPLSFQDLAQTLFQQTLRATTLFPVAEPVTGSAGLLQDAAASLLASLSAPQTLTATSPLPTTTTNPALIPVQDTQPSTAPPSAPPATIIGDQPASQDAFATSLSPDFAAQTALRFGAGVAAQAALALPATDLGTGLVRDASRVLRLGNLQPREGGPGPEAFAQAQATIQRVLRTYEGAPAGTGGQGSSLVDLLA